jgi:dUTP pyrophosphatase
MRQQKERSDWLKLRIKKEVEDIPTPAYAHEGDAGLDLYAAEETVLQPGERKLVSTGIRIALEKGFEAQVRPKSGLAVNQGITILNTPGTIDFQYRGLVKVILYNASQEAYKIEKGKKIAQMVVNKVESAQVEVVEELDETVRGDGGFGSTGLD